MECAKLIHPFQNDAGISQQARAAAELLSAAPKIDGRTLADLLHYFQQLSRNVNFYQYDNDAKRMTIGDWQPFFQKSLPFVLSSIIKYNPAKITSQLERYNDQFAKNPSVNGLQLIIHFIFNKVIAPVDNWSRQLKDSGLPAKTVVEKLITNRLSSPVKSFICLSNAASAEFNVRTAGFAKLISNNYWGLTSADLAINNCFKIAETSKRRRLIALSKKIVDLAPLFIDAIRTAATSAELCIDASLEPAKEELQKKHAPHLALIFAFLKLFGNLQGDLNGLTRKHLNFFYQQVLKLTAKNAVPDRAHLLVEIQTLLTSYKLEQGVTVKAGKDEKKAEMLFTLDNEIVVNKTTVADVKTLFLNNRPYHQTSYVEGVYMAPDALKADGIKTDFKSDPKSWPALGAKYSKYRDPETKLLKQYPNGRVGFALASPVLLLREGTRKVDVTLVCKLDTGVCSASAESATFVRAVFLPLLQAVLNTVYYIINIELLEEAIKKGLTKPLSDSIQADHLSESTTPPKLSGADKLLTSTEWVAYRTTKAVTHADSVVLDDIFKPQTIFNIWLSGDKEWIPAKDIRLMELLPLAGVDNYAFNFSFTLDALQAPVTFFNAEILQEELDTQFPVLKMELNDAIKLHMLHDDVAKLPELVQNNPHCCLEREPDKDLFISFYHFFRNLVVVAQGQCLLNASVPVSTRIDVDVTGVKNLIVQNTDTLLDINKPLLPFGARPKIDNSFYIGSQEIFSKNWQHFDIHATWKDAPEDFKDYYKHYSRVINNIIDNDSFLMDGAVLEKGQWQADGQKKIFKVAPPPAIPDWNKQLYSYSRPAFPTSSYTQLKPDPEGLQPLSISSTYGFLRLTLKGSDFLHDKFALVLMEHILDLSGLMNTVDFDHARKTTIEIGNTTAQIINIISSIQINIIDILSAVAVAQFNLTNDATAGFDPTLDGIQLLVQQIKKELDDAETDFMNGNPASARGHVTAASLIIPEVFNRIGAPGLAGTLDDSIDIIRKAIDGINTSVNLSGGLVELAQELDTKITALKDDLKITTSIDTDLPHEPYTPTIVDLSLDYTAIANIDDMELIHLHPFKDTYQTVEIEATPTLFPSFCNEGHLFLGLENLIPGSNLNILFKLAEATADSESDEQDVAWHYLDNNQWKLLPAGSGVLKDETDDLTATGIIQFSLPENMTKGNTILPKNYHWIRASINSNSRGVSEVMNINTQAVSVTFASTPENDTQRFAKPLAAGTINRLNDPDANIKQITQPYESFGGQVPEIQNNFYVRVAELLRHKGRAIQPWDYERLTLEQFPEVFKTKCITHSFWLDANNYVNDFPMAPGYVLLAVIPDLNKLNAAKSFTPQLPVSILLKIEDYLKKRTSPFVHLKVKNPRYETVDFSIKLKLLPGKDPFYHKQLLMQELREFMAPWAIGEYDKLRFGQCINRSDIIQFLESRNYLDYIIELKMSLQGQPVEDVFAVCPVTPRSILIAGDINVEIPKDDCDQFADENPCAKKPVVIAGIANYAQI